MKALLFFVFVAFLAVFANAQNFYVINAQGKILADDKELKTGDKLSNESIISFTSLQDKLYLLSPSSGYFLLSPEEQQNEKEWVVALKNALIPKNKYYKTATRGISDNNGEFEDIYDLMGFFRNHVLIVDGTTFKYNVEQITLDDKNHFEFLNPEGKVVNMKINENTFLLSGNFSKANFEMNYIENLEPQKIGSFILTFCTRESIAAELAVLFENQPQNNATSIYFENVVPYIQDAYGNTNMEVIRNIITHDLKIPLMVKSY